MVGQRLAVEITGAPLRTVRPLMLRALYSNPEKELVRLRDLGLVVKIGPGTYTAKPDTVPQDRLWRPAFEEAAMAYATAQYAARVPVLFGIGAARFHHAIPRAIAVTVIAVPRQHRPVRLEDGGRVIFTTTDTSRLDARHEQGALGRFLVTTPEQTILDLLDQPKLGGIEAEAGLAIRAIATVVDPHRARNLAQHRSRRVRAELIKALDAA
jgi:hypothetical protein